MITKINTAILFFLIMIFACSTSEVFLYHGDVKNKSQLSILEVKTPNVKKKEEALLVIGERLYTPSLNSKTFIHSINGAMINDFIIRPDQVKNVKKYFLKPGKQELGIMYEGNGKSVKFTKETNFNRVFTHDTYSCNLDSPIFITINTKPGEIYIVKTHVSEDTCKIQVENNEIELTKNYGLLKFKYETKSIEMKPKKFDLDKLKLD